MATLIEDRARVASLLARFDATDDRDMKVRLMEEALRSVEEHKTSRADVAFILRGECGSSWSSWGKRALRPLALSRRIAPQRLFHGLVSDQARSATS